MHVQPKFEIARHAQEQERFSWTPLGEEPQSEAAGCRSYYHIASGGAAMEACWSNSFGKRIFDVTLAWIGLVALSPVMAVSAIAVKLSSAGPILFRQTRMGSQGRTFTILKFRTMRTGLEATGPSVTKAGDERLTRIGSLLRKSKLDEFPQLINVLHGDMSLIGPRPKIPHHQTTILNFRPGITGAASLAFRDEEQVLHRIPEKHLDDYQVHVLMPMKTELDESYMRNATFSSDVGMLFRTVFGGAMRSDLPDTERAQHSLVLLKTALDRANDQRAGFAVDQAAS